MVSITQSHHKYSGLLTWNIYSTQSLGQRPWAIKLVGTVEQKGGSNFPITGKKKKENSSQSDQVHSSPKSTVIP